MFSTSGKSDYHFHSSTPSPRRRTPFVAVRKIAAFQLHSSRRVIASAGTTRTVLLHNIRVCMCVCVCIRYTPTIYYLSIHMMSYVCECICFREFADVNRCSNVYFKQNGKVDAFSKFKNTYIETGWRDSSVTVRVCV